MRTELETALLRAGFSCPPATIEKMVEFYELLIQWNRKANLTALTEPEDFINKHILDSLYPARFLGEGTLADVGTGAGFPGLPLKLFMPQVRLTLVEAAAKKVAFLEHCTSSLAVEAEIVHGRAEELGRSLARESFVYATARAVAALSVICEYCLPLLRVGGRLLALKGPSSEGEVKSAAGAIELLGGELTEIVNYNLPNGDPRSLIVIEKVLPTPAKYPRRPGVPAKKPLA